MREFVGQQFPALAGRGRVFSGSEDDLVSSRVGFGLDRAGTLLRLGDG
jgi:hypothetical protein